MNEEEEEEVRQRILMEELEYREACLEEQLPMEDPLGELFDQWREDFSPPQN